MNIVTIILGICTLLALIWLRVTKDNAHIPGVLSVILLISFGVLFLKDTTKDEKSYHHNTKPTGWYYLNVADSPHIPNVHPELDYTLNDTAYINWYSNDYK